MISGTRVMQPWQQLEQQTSRPTNTVLNGMARYFPSCKMFSWERRRQHVQPQSVSPQYPFVHAPIQPRALQAPHVPREKILERYGEVLALTVAAVLEYWPRRSSYLIDKSWFPCCCSRARIVSCPAPITGLRTALDALWNANLISERFVNK